MPDRFLVKGNIHVEGGPAVGLFVVAFDQDLPSRRHNEERLGDTTTDSQGYYEIAYSAEQFVRAEKQSADLFIRVFGPNQRQLGVSDVLPQAPPDATISLVLVPQQEPMLSEYEQLLAELRPILEEVQLADLTDEDIAFLIGETGIDRQRLELLRQGAQHSRITGLPAEVFFGLGSQHPLIDLEHLLLVPRDFMRRDLEAAVFRNSIPAVIGASLDEIMRRFDQLRVDRGLWEVRQFIGQLLDAASLEPFAGFGVRGFDLSSSLEPKDLGLNVTGEQGLFAVSYAAPRLAPNPDQPIPPVLRVRLQVLDTRSEEVHREELELQPGQTEIMQIKVQLPPVQRPPAPALAQLAETLNLQLPEALLPALAERGIQTLADIRRTGGVSRLKGLPVAADHPALQELDAHARLGVLSSDVELNQLLIDAGFVSLAAIAKAPRARFAALAGEQLGDFKAVQMQVMARAEVQYARNVAAGVRADTANHFAPEEAGMAVDFGERLPEVCGCDDCLAAVSPLAYLADLLDYALDNLEPDPAAPRSLGLLTDTFHQPFSTLLAECEAVDKQVRQVRICIEVLRSSLGKRPLEKATEETLQAAEKAYLLDAYTTLLTRLGVSHEEIRLARTEKPEDRKRLADRLGINLGSTRPDPLDEMFLDGDAKPGDDNALTEQNAEKIFGLPDTSRVDPLAAIPASRLLTWRLDHLRTLWKGRDHPTDSYSPEFVPAVGRLPIIDPDLIGPDDFRTPMETGKAFKIWLKRRKEVIGIWDAFRKAREDGGEDGMALVLEKALGTAAIKEIDGLVTSLREGTKAAVQHAHERIAAFNLTIESFSRLMLLRDKDQRATTEKLPVLALVEDEWREVYSILTQAAKERLYPEWIAEEQDKTTGIVFGTREFWISEREPTEGDWPPIQSASPPVVPLIDPDTVRLTELPERTAGKSAIGIWNERRAKLDEVGKALRAERKKGFEAVLVMAFGPADAATTWGKKLAALKEQSTSGKPGDAEAAAKAVAALGLTSESFDRLVLLKTKDELSHIPVKPPATPPVPLNDAEWTEVALILTAAQKVRKLFPDWVKQEKTEKLDTEYWRARKARLPRWRSTIEGRQQWRRALGSRSVLPIIDPDLLRPGDFKEASAKDPAYKLYGKSASPKESTARTKVVQDFRNAAIAVAKTKEGLAGIVRATVGVELSELSELAEAERNGEDITARLGQLSLTGAAFNYLLRVDELLRQTPPAPVLDAEWEAVASILAQVNKQRLFPEWREEEKSSGLIRGPDQFRFPPVDPTRFPPLPPEKLPPWLATREDRLDWEDTLQTRIDQEATVKEALASAISETEEAALPRLRDALVMAGAEVAGYPAKDLDARAKWVTDQLLIDAKADGCQMTTRVTQAIETVQNLIFSARTKQFRGKPNFLFDEFEQETFDETWKWMGSYSTWRAAIFVFLYPENILLPSLRKWQTPGFSKLIGDLRGNRRLTPTQACKAYDEYAQYFHDVTHLTLEASCQTATRTRKSAGCHDVPGDDYRYLFYMFARGEATNKVYWSACDGTDPSGYAQTFWQEIEGLGTNVTSIIGAVPYHMAGREPMSKGSGDKTQPKRFIFLFSTRRESGGDKLQFLRFDLENHQWDKETTELKWPTETNAFTAVPVQTQSESKPPRLAIHIHGTREVYDRSLNVEGTDWEKGDASSDRGAESRGEWDLFYQSALKEYDIFALNAVFDPPSVFCYTDSSRNARVRNLFFDAPADGSFVGSFLGEKETAYIFLENPTGKFYQRIISGSAAKIYPALSDLRKVFPSCGRVPFSQKQVACQRGGMEAGIFRSIFRPAAGVVSWSLLERAAPSLDKPFDRDGLASNRAYLDESQYFVPVHLALQLQKSGEFIAALDWFRRVYDYSKPIAERKLPDGIDVGKKSIFKRSEDWLLDPINPHQVGATRKNTYTRFTVLCLVRCLLEFADAEFTRDTAESVPRARTLYLTALELLDSQALRQGLGRCDDIIGKLEIQIGDPVWFPLWEEVKEGLTKVGDAARLETVVEEVKEIVGRDAPLDVRLMEARRVINEILSATPAPTLASVLADEGKITSDIESFLFSQPSFAEASEKVGAAAARDFLEAVASVSGIDALRLESGKVKLPLLIEPIVFSTRDSGGLPDSLDSGGAHAREVLRTRTIYEEGVRILAPLFAFCVPPNPMLKALRSHAELNLYKLRTCRNIAGMKRQLEPYAAQTDTVSGLPMIGAGGQLVLPGTVVFQPTPYRYSTLIDRAKQLVGHAQQIEAAMFSSLIQGDVESYNLLKARQDAGLTRAGVRLQDLRITETQDGVDLAKLQQDRAQLQVNHYDSLLAEGLSDLEEAAIVLMFAAAGLQFAAAAAGSFAKPPDAAQVFSALGQGVSMTASILSNYASYARRAEEWRFDKDLAQQDVQIGAQQVKIAQDHVRVTGQERVIAQMQADHAEVIVDFLANKFGNVELYDWMSGVLGRVYGFFLQQATAMAQLASGQLAFERQEMPPSYIQMDYWEAPADDGIAGISGGTPDRRGLTGSARLLQDIYQLDQYAFDTNKRKLQLSKTISLAQLAPAEFQRFRESGVMLFRTPLEMFDRDFPGHYLRLIRRVRTSVVALIPPIQGIKATLTCGGLSRVTIGGDVFQTTIVRRDPQSVALSSPRDATGLFELDIQPEMLLPLEGIGVDTSWELRMPKAANFFDFRTVADVLLTIDYSALSSFDYQQQVIQTLRPTLSVDRPFSFRHQFADAWYDLNNPYQTATPMSVHFTTTQSDFPPNLDRLKIQQVVLYFARSEGRSFEIPVSELRFAEEGAEAVAGGAISQDGVISTLKGNAGNWTAMIGKTPVGEWTLSLPDTAEMRNRFKNEEIEDILFVLTVAGRTAEWPT